MPPMQPTKFQSQIRRQFSSKYLSPSLKKKKVGSDNEFKLIPVISASIPITHRPKIQFPTLFLFQKIPMVMQISIHQKLANSIPLSGL